MAETMQALTYFGEGDVRVDTRPKPTILDPTDAIIRIDTTTICEAMQNFKPGDKVLISRCGACERPANHVACNPPLHVGPARSGVGDVLPRRYTPGDEGDHRQPLAAEELVECSSVGVCVVVSGW